jgi:hypothetical protein
MVTLIGVICSQCKNHIVALACSGCGEEYSYGVGNPLKKDNVKHCARCGEKFDKVKSVEELQEKLHCLKIQNENID